MPLTTHFSCKVVTMLVGQCRVSSAAASEAPAPLCNWPHDFADKGTGTVCAANVHVMYNSHGLSWLRAVGEVPCPIIALT